MRERATYGWPEGRAERARLSQISHMGTDEEGLGCSRQANGTAKMPTSAVTDAPL